MMHAGRDVLNLLPPTSLQYLPPLPYAQPSKAYRLKFEEQMRALHAPKVSTSTKHTMPSLVSTFGESPHRIDVATNSLAGAKAAR